MSSRKLKLALLISIGAALVAFSAALAFGAASNSPTPAVYAESPHAAKVSAVPVGLTQALSIFRGQAAAGSQVPIDIVFPDDLNRGANPSLGVYATTVDGQAIYLLPTSDGVCMASTTFVAEGCFSTADLSSGPLGETVVCSPYLANDQVEVYGIVPDDVSGLSAVLSDGSTEPVAVNGNVFVVDAPRSGPYPVSLRWSQSGVSESTLNQLFTPAQMNLPCGGGTPPSVTIAAERAALGAAAGASTASASGRARAASAAARNVLRAHGVAVSTGIRKPTRAQEARMRSLLKRAEQATASRPPRHHNGGRQ
jgi:hypothetical protein